jgi:hypothetical protein
MPGFTTNRIIGMTIIGGKLIISGMFLYADGRMVNKICSWNGTEICPLNFGVDNEVFNVYTLNNYLYGVGAFYYADGNPYNNIFKYQP